ncbi:hypothetical protein G6O67_002587 [Ophiocordyceps sinensis]|uniref:Uncharacterized protein n=1 Tax=Ophiocordyceps sinensis TaxID=72228 RepID=A0A8H4PUG4_9HYPO|nr:hypothetical protein G6O67_002587 [Ophiocordyceps sinensis]
MRAFCIPILNDEKGQAPIFAHLPAPRASRWRQALMRSRLGTHCFGAVIWFLDTYMQMQGIGHAGFLPRQADSISLHSMTPRQDKRVTHIVRRRQGPNLQPQSSAGDSTDNATHFPVRDACANQNIPCCRIVSSWPMS